VASIFVSHSSQDAEQATRLLAWLRAQGFDQTFLDIDKHGGIAPGTEWEKKLYREMARSDAVLLVLTKNWFASKWCFVEFAQARALGKAIFPLIETPKGETYIAQDIQNLDLTIDREGGLDQLAAELRRIALDAQGEFPWDITRAPFPGLLAFDETDAAVYFGRDDDIRKLIERLNARRAQGGARILALLGASGSGKSSLLRAGLLPRLKRDKRNWIVLPPFRPQIHPIDELAQAIALGLGQANEWRTWRDRLCAPDVAHSLSDLARDLRAANGANEAQVLISIDQAEELFGTADKKESQQLFELLNAMGEAELPFLTIMALRSDYLDQLQQADALKASFEEFSLKPMPLDRLRQVIEGPARVGGLLVEDELIEAAKKDAATDDALPLLAFALRELYDRFGKKSKHLTLAHYRALADEATQSRSSADQAQKLSPLEYIVRRRADEVLSAAKPGPDDLAALKDAFIPAMVRVNLEGEYVRRPASLNDLPAKAIPLLDRLDKARLLVTRQEGKARYIEVAHESLLRKWPLLRDWLDSEREFLIGKEQLKQDSQEWENAANEVKDQALLSGLKLTRARLWLLERPHQLSNLERNFVQASVDRQEAEQTRRERLRRLVLSGSIAATLILAVLSGFAFWQRNIATKALADAEKYYKIALDQAAGGMGLLTKSFDDGAISNKLLQQLIEKAEASLNEMSGETDELAAARAKLFHVLSIANLMLGNVVSARNFVNNELALADKLMVKSPANEEWIHLSEVAHSQLSEVLYWSGDAASGALDEARIAKDIAGRLVQMRPDSDEFQHDLMDNYRNIGDALSDVGQLEEANNAYASMLNIALERSARNSSNADWQASVAAAQQELGDVQMQQYRPLEAAGHFQVTARIMSELMEQYPDNTAYRAAHANARERLGDALLGQDKFADAMVQYDTARKDADTLLKIEPTNLRWRQLLETTYQRIGDLLLKQKDYDNALQKFQAYLSLTEDSLPLSKDNGGARYDVANARLKIGDALREKGEFNNALLQYQQSLEIALELNRIKWNGSWSKILAMDYQRLGLVLRAQGDMQGARIQFANCTAVKVNKFAWSPRTIWPPDVIDFCQKQINEIDPPQAHR
jgi:tetratricopeptide (TPR) repeat protein